jgi:hypothetical protein
MTKKDEKGNLKNKRNIEIKVDPKTGIAKGNLFKQPIVTNNPSVKVGKTFSGKIDLNPKSKKN